VDLPLLEPEIDWRKIHDFGNRLRHEYDQIAPDAVADVLANHLAPLRAAALRLQTRFDPDQPNERPIA
jgi:uncharacterized protein with HEPN domain